MKSQKKENGAGHAFRLVPHSEGKVLVGVAAVVAVSSFAFLVFGPLADQRALALAGYEAARRGRRQRAAGRGNAWRGWCRGRSSSPARPGRSRSRGRSCPLLPGSLVLGRETRRRT